MTPTKRPDLDGFARYLEIARKLPPAAAVVAIALFLVWLTAGSIPAKLDAHAAETRAASEKTLYVLERICVGLAKTDDEARRCIAIRAEEK